MKLTLTTIFLFCSNIAVFAQCNIAQSPSEITDIHTFSLSATSTIEIDSRSYCLEEADIVMDMDCSLQTTSYIVSWYRVNSLNFPSLTHSTVTTNKDTEAIWRYYTIDDNDQVLPYGPCNIGDVSPEVLTVEVDMIDVLLLKVMIPFDDIPTQSDSVTVNVFESTYFQAQTCYNTDIHGQPESMHVEIVDRSIGELGIDFIFPGEIVEIEISIEVNLQVPGDAWVSGVLPILGDGWDYEHFINNRPEMTYSALEGEWIADGDPCQGEFMSDVGMLCTYYDDTGNLRICNRLTHDCPCNEGSFSGITSLPTGWYFLTIGSGVDCNADCTPSTSYGGQGQSGVIDLTLKLRASLDAEIKDLTVGFQILPDNIIGCWGGDEEVCDFLIPFLSNDLIKELPENAEYLVLNASEIVCPGAPVDFSVIISDSLMGNAFLHIDDNPDVLGIPSQPIMIASTGISLDLTNLSTEVQSVVAYAFAINSGGDTVTSFAVDISLLPQFELLSDSIKICMGECKLLLLETNWDGFVPFDYLWDDGTTIKIKEICEGELPHIRLTDRLGCGVFEEDIFEEVSIPLNPEIIGPDRVCIENKIAIFESNYEVVFFGMAESIQWRLIAPSFFTTGFGTTFSLNGITLPITLIGESGQLLVTTTSEDGCTEEAEFDIAFESTISELQSGFSFCENDFEEGEDLLFTIPLIIDSTAIFQGVTFPVNVGDVTYMFNGFDAVFITIINPVSSTYTLDIVVNYMEECSKEYIYPVNIVSSSNLELDIDIHDFEVDFTLLHFTQLDSVHWEFGDGTTSTEIFPTHIYQDTGIYQMSVTIFSPCGEASFLDAVTIVGTTTLVKESIEESIRIFPNPIHSNLVISGLQGRRDIMVQILNIVGKKVYSLEVKNGIDEVSLDVSILPAGSYILYLSNEDFAVAKKIVLSD